MIVLWISFFLLVASFLFLDLHVFNKKEHEIKLKEALKFSAFWISVAVIFNIFVYFWFGHQKALEFLAGYLIEESLSIDNLFVFLMIFSYFKVPPKYQHKILYWGILSAIVMRFVFILTGVALVTKFHWVIYIFGAFLVFSAIKMVVKKDEEVHLDDNPLIKLFKKFFPVTNDYKKGHFFEKINGKLFATPLFIVLIAIETSDLAFAVDSIPAVLAVSTDPFIIYTSNIFAILGLRSLYFALAGLMPIFHYLKYGLALILGFIGVKMLITDFYKMPIGQALGIVAGILFFSVILSILYPPKKEKGEQE